jgi:hypothetical protein
MRPLYTTPELDSKSQSSGPISRVTDMHATLEAKIKSLEADLKRSESEKETILVEMSANTGFLPGFGASSGVNERTKILNLENQVEGLRKENIRLMEESRKVSYEREMCPPVADLASGRHWHRPAALRRVHHLLLHPVRDSSAQRLSLEIFESIV